MNRPVLSVWTGLVLPLEAMVCWRVALLCWVVEERIYCRPRTSQHSAAVAPVAAEVEQLDLSSQQRVEKMTYPAWPSPVQRSTAGINSQWIRKDAVFQVGTHDIVVAVSIQRRRIGHGTIHNPPL